MKRLLVFGLAVVAGFLVWRWANRGVISARTEPDRPVSEAVAEAADARLRQLRTGETSMVVLHGHELQSLLEYRYLQLLPAFVEAPEIELANGQLHVRARVPVERLPSLNELGEAAYFLPDTAELALTGTLLPLDSGRVALVIQQVRAARVPLPQRLVPRALQQLGRKEEPGLPRNALALPLPPGAAGAILDADSLMFVAQPVSRSNH